MTETLEGGCACGKVRYAVRIENRDAYLCHCRMCQRASGNISLAMKGVAKADIDWLSEPDWYESSVIARRPYCAACGTSLGFAFKEGENADITIASLDDPYGFTPTHHFGIERWHQRWLDTSDLKQIRAEEHQGLIDRWVAAGTTMPE